ncbi:MAG: tetratricopeptide repeat protein [Pseudomonadota bacterium]
MFTSSHKRLVLLFAVAMLHFGMAAPALAQSDPSLSQVYAAVQAGKLDQAQTMMQQVLVAHPNSAKAHFVRAEIFARQGKAALARESLASAEKLAPGLPFAKPEAVQSLRAQIVQGGASGGTAPRAKAPSPQGTSFTPAASAAPSSSFSWGLPLLLGVGVILVGYLAFRRKPPQTFTPPPSAVTTAAPGSMIGSGLNGPQTFGGNSAAPQQPYGSAPQQPYGAAAPAPGMGSRIAGGVATGLAVGAGMMAANAIGKTLTGDHERDQTRQSDNAASANQPIPDANYNMGGENFGVNDVDSWDDGGAGGGGDWDT